MKKKTSIRCCGEHFPNSSFVLDSEQDTNLLYALVICFIYSLILGVYILCHDSKPQKSGLLACSLMFLNSFAQCMILLVIH